MKIFGFGSSAKQLKLRITEADREWVEGNFQWLSSAYGAPVDTQMSISDKYFPKTFSNENIRIENLIADCCWHLNLDASLFSYHVYEDIRDSVNIPYQMGEKRKDCVLSYDESTGKYSLALANDLFQHPSWMISSVCCEFTKALLLETKADIGDDQESDAFVYLAAVYFGYGVIIARNLTNIGRKNVGLYEKRWSYRAEISYPVIAYALAAFARLNRESKPDWRAALPEEVRSEFDLSEIEIAKSTSELFDIRRIDNAIAASELHSVVNNHVEAGEMAEAIAILQKMIFLVDDDEGKATLYNNIGYYKTRLGEYSSSISDFQNAFSLSPDFAFPYDNLGFALIMLGELERGKTYLDKAQRTASNDPAYSFRNLALYYQRKGDNHLAEEYFQKAFLIDTPVDLLDFYYGKFHHENGDFETAQRHIQISAGFGEREGIDWLAKYNSR